MVRVDVSGLCAAGNSVISMQDITGVGQLCTNLLLADYPLVQPEVTNKYCILFQPLILWQWNLMLSGFLMKHHPMKTKGGEGVQVSRTVFVSAVWWLQHLEIKNGSSHWIGSCMNRGAVNRRRFLSYWDWKPSRRAMGRHCTDR